MNLLEPERSQFDWSFRLFGIDVRVQPMFWLVTLLLGFRILQREWLEVPTRFFFLLLWTAAVFISILVHEMGHVTMGNIFGSRGYIVLAGFFGLAIGSSELSNRWQRVAVSFAGPLAGFILLAAVLLMTMLYDPEMVWPALARELAVRSGADWLIELLEDFVWINLFWGLINLLPIWPLDGGKISQELFQHFMRSNGLRISLIVSLVTAAIFAVNALISMAKKGPFIPYIPEGDLFTVCFFGFFAVGSWQMLQQVDRGGGGGGRRWVDEDYDRRAPWEQDADWWKRGR